MGGECERVERRGCLAAYRWPTNGCWEYDNLINRHMLPQDDLFVRELADNPKSNSMNIWPLHGYGRKTARRWIAWPR